MLALYKLKRMFQDQEASTFEIMFRKNENTTSQT